MFGVPVHVPWSAVSVWPWRVVPEIDGSVVFAGATASTRAVWVVVAAAVPAEFVAVTTARMVAATSALVSV